MDYEHAPMFATLPARSTGAAPVVAVGGPAPDEVLTGAAIAAASAAPPDVGEAAGSGGTTGAGRTAQVG